MPVIGRLDGQVDEVLIAPLERRRRGGGEQPGEPAESRDELEESAPQDEAGKRAAREELPVWLL